MKCNASWQGTHNPVIRVQLTVAPGELHPAVTTPAEVEAWLRTLLDGHRAARKVEAK